MSEEFVKMKLMVFVNKENDYYINNMNLSLDLIDDELALGSLLKQIIQDSLSAKKSEKINENN